MRVGEVDVPWQLSGPGPAGFGTHGHRVESAWATVGYMIGKCSTCWAWRKSARYSVVGVMSAPAAGFFGCFFGGVTATLPSKPLPITTATCARGPVMSAIAAGTSPPPAQVPQDVRQVAGGRRGARAVEGPRVGIVLVGGIPGVGAVAPRRSGRRPSRPRP